MRRRAVLSIVGWTLLFMVALDIGLGLAFRYPDDNRQRPSELQSYFDYGRSIEGKLSRSIGRDDAEASGVSFIGWLATDCIARAAPAGAAGLGISVFGMSFTNHIAAELERLDPRVRIATHWGPGAPASHSHACFRRIDDAGGDGNPVQVIGILASSVYRTLGMTGATAAFEAPTPYTYPRYRLAADGQLLVEEPSITSLAQWREPARRDAFLDQLSTGDRFFDRWLMTADATDHSVLVRLARRAYAQRSLAERQRRWVGGPAGFVDDPELGPVVSALLRDFAARVSARGAMPIVLLIQDRPGSDTLVRLLGPDLARAGIAFLSTHDIVPTTDPSNFLGDGHFTEAANRRIAERLLVLARAQRVPPSGQ